MAGAAAEAPAAGGGGKKKLILIIVAVLVLVLVGVAALLLMKKKSHAEDGEEAEAPAAHATVKAGTPPTFVPLDPFTVNLADKEVDRYAQIGVTLEVADPKVADQIKAYMPAIRNNVLMVLSHKTSADLLTQEGKEKLAREIRRESVRPMGVELDDEEEDADAPKKKKKKRRAPDSPVTQVLFSTFIVQ
ncbi:flagellar basal body-associated FliL family protein [Pelomonas sp. CA6]|uniref:flagellar basal body-associated FliL family protein n=1 Tax=Pelomonas sp. CA6 TaxID=2907999 RepID=UPI001F4BEFF9|nr:flagellar basal body-associated FliL family protein [Pelomonas sp. CA6]MCH7345848.1 flagellar basal body-associated FliL family protein [Pelomonas sp. CA6]